MMGSDWFIKVLSFILSLSLFSSPPWADLTRWIVVGCSVRNIWLAVQQSKWQCKHGGGSDDTEQMSGLTCPKFFSVITLISLKRATHHNHMSMRTEETEDQLMTMVQGRQALRRYWKTPSKRCFVYVFNGLFYLHDLLVSYCATYVRPPWSAV